MEDWYYYTQAQNISTKYELLLYTMAIVHHNQRQFEAFLQHLEQLQMSESGLEMDDDLMDDLDDGCPGWLG